MLDDVKKKKIKNVCWHKKKRRLEQSHNANNQG